MSDIINYGGDGRFLMTSVCGKLWALDVTVTTTGDSPKLTELTKNIEYPFSTNQGQNIYLANSNGDILLTVIAKKWAGLLHHVEIFRFESDQQCWVPLRGGLGDRSLFVGSCSSFSLSARQVPELKPNCVYCQWIEEGVTSRFGRFHLEDGSVDYFSYPPKRLLDSFPLPLWFAPSLL